MGQIWDTVGMIWDTVGMIWDTVGMIWGRFGADLERKTGWDECLPQTAP